jgi:PHD/YefM family antitoxin component YafN of YafNO toxin-antitoxin module
MRTISVTEFRSNIKRYLDIAQDEKVMIYRGKGRTFAVIPMEKTTETNLLSDAQNKAINEALEDIANGRVYSHEEVLLERKTRYPHLFK